MKIKIEREDDGRYIAEVPEPMDWFGMKKRWQAILVAELILLASVILVALTSGN
jgi:hypothetical protein